MRHLFFLSALLLLVPSTPAAQVSIPGLSPGTRIRISAPTMLDRRLIGQVTELNPDSLKVAEEPTGAHIVLSLSAIASVEHSVGRSHGAGARRGAVAGALAGVGLGLVCFAVCTPAPGNESHRILAPVAGLFYGAVGGAALGALMPPERWQTLPLSTRSGATLSVTDTSSLRIAGQEAGIQAGRTASVLGPAAGSAAATLFLTPYIGGAGSFLTAMVLSGEPAQVPQVAPQAGLPAYQKAYREAYQQAYRPRLRRAVGTSVLVTSAVWLGIVLGMGG